MQKRAVLNSYYRVHGCSPLFLKRVLWDSNFFFSTANGGIGWVWPKENLTILFLMLLLLLLMDEGGAGLVHKRESL